MEIRRATADDLLAFYGRLPERTTHAVVGVQDDGTIAGVGGVTHTPRGNIAFLDLAVDASTVKRDLVRAARMLLRDLEDRHAMVIAYPDDAEVAPRFLSHWGFERTDGGWYRWRA